MKKDPTPREKHTTPRERAEMLSPWVKVEEGPDKEVLLQMFTSHVIQAEKAIWLRAAEMFETSIKDAFTHETPGWAKQMAAKLRGMVEE